MKTSLSRYYYQLLLINKNTKSGFTLIELLAVILIIGILSVVGFNSFLNFAPKAKQSEAKAAINAINSGQSSYRFEHPTFANDINKLTLGLPTTTASYNYAIIDSNDIIATVSAATTDTALKEYAGASEKYNDGNNKVVVANIICEAEVSGINITAPISGIPGTNACGTDKELGQP